MFTVWLRSLLDLERTLCLDPPLNKSSSSHLNYNWVPPHPLVFPVPLDFGNLGTVE
ncbi:hypothetical protein DBR06_SOUSAS34210011, partial [Sousa chinensis]